jgi:hypothetical protein
MPEPKFDRKEKEKRKTQKLKNYWKKRKLENVKRVVRVYVHAL